MITIRQIERLWTAGFYEKLLRELVAARPEGNLRFEVETGSALPAAALALIRLDELSQSSAPINAKLIQKLLAAQDRDGGWCDPMITALCVRALMCGRGNGPAIDRGMQYLADLQKSDGAWPRVPLRRMPADGFATAFILLQLSDQPTFRHAVQFNLAVRWFHQNRDILDRETIQLWDRTSTRCLAMVSHGMLQPVAA